MKPVIVNFVEIENALKVINENITKIKEKKGNLESLVTGLGEDWKDSISNSYGLYKDSSFNLAKDIESGATEIENLSKLIEEAMKEYKDNEDSGETIIRSVEF